jgi:hypothetical protein
MKNVLSLCLLVALVAILAACNTPNRAADGNSSSDPYTQQWNNTLADVLRKNTGLQVLGTGDNVKIIVRGISTIKLNTQPLYVVDGVPIGNDYSSANNLVNPREVTDVEVLRSTSDLVQWGENANNGVILITTVNNSKN